MQCGVLISCLDRAGYRHCTIVGVRTQYEVADLHWIGAEYHPIRNASSEFAPNLARQIACPIKEINTQKPDKPIHKRSRRWPPI